MILKTVYLLLSKKLDLDQIAFFDHNLMEWCGRALHTSVIGATAKTAPAGRSAISAADCQQYRQAAGAFAVSLDARVCQRWRHAGTLQACESLGGEPVE